MARPKVNAFRINFTNELFPGSDYGDEELEFLKAMQEHIKRTGQRFPPYTAVLRVLKSLGYEKQTSRLG